MAMDEKCSSLLCVDLTAAAASHAQVVGVLAGFAAAAIAVVLARSEGDSAGSLIGRRHDGISSLFVALFTLTVAAFIYGTAAGVEGSAQRAAAMTFAAGIVTAVAVVNLALGLAGLLAVSAHRDLVPTVGRFVALIVPFSGSIYIFISATDVLRADNSDEPSETWVELALTGLALLILINGFLVLGLLIRSRQARSVRRRLPRLAITEDLLAVSSLVMTSVALTYFLVLLYVPESVARVWVLPIAVGTWSAFLVILFEAVATILGAEEGAGQG